MPVITLEQHEIEDMLIRAAKLGASQFRDDLEKAQTPEIMTKAELAGYLRCDVSKIDRYMKKGLPFVSFGSHPRFHKIDIDRWLRNR